MSFTLNRKAKQLYKLIVSSEKEYADPEGIGKEIKSFYVDQVYKYLKDKDPSIKSTYAVYHNLECHNLHFSQAEENAFAEASLNNFRQFLPFSIDTSLGRYIDELQNQIVFYDYYKLVNGEGPVSEYGLDGEKIRKTGPDAYTIITVIANTLLPEGEIFRPDQPQTTKFGVKFVTSAHTNCQNPCIY